MFFKQAHIRIPWRLPSGKGQPIRIRSENICALSWKREGGKVISNFKDLPQYKALLSKGKAVGYLTFDEVNKALPPEFSRT